MVHATSVPGKKGFRIQLASFPDRELASAELGKMQKKYTAALGPARLHLTKTDLGARGIYYRVQSNPITDTEARDEIASIDLYIAEYGTFPGGATSLAYPDITGTMHTFPTIGAFASFAKAIADYIAAVIETGNINANGGDQAFPSASATIP